MACDEGDEQQEQQQQPNLKSPKKSTVKGKQKKKGKNKKISQQQKTPLSDPSKQQRTTSRIGKVLKAKQQRIIRNKNAMKRIPKVLKTKQRRIIQNKNALKRIPKVLKKQTRKQQHAKADKKKKQRKLRSILKKKTKKKRGRDGSGENKVTFDDVVYIREYERILVEQQLFVHYVYACLALGWNCNHQTDTKISKVNFDLNYQQRSSLKLLSTPFQSSKSPTMIPNIQEHKDDKEKEEPSKLYPRSTATERVQILTEYGFGLKEVIKNEMLLKRKLERQQEQQQQQQESLKEHQNATATQIVGDNMKRVLSSAYNNFVRR